MHEFLENIVGFCKEQLAPIKGGGIFGHCKGYTCAIESNGRFFLHLHSLLYIHGLPRTQAEFDDAMHKPAFKEQFKEYVNSIMQQFIAEQNWAQQAPCNGCETNSAPPPVFPLVTVLNTTPSITRIGNGPMKAIPLATTANKQGQRYAAAAPSMECITCKHQYTTAARFEEFLVFFKSLHPTVNFPTSAEVLAEKCQPSPVAWPKKLTEESTGECVLAWYRLYVLQHQLQIHTHKVQCFTKGILCKRRYGRMLEEQGGFFEISATPCLCEHCLVHHTDQSYCSCTCTCELSSTPLVDLERPAASACREDHVCVNELDPTARQSSVRYHPIRPLGSEFVVGHNPVVCHMERCNSDVQVMGDLRNIYYTTKYHTKNQNKLESKEDIAIEALGKRICREQLAAERGQFGSAQQIAQGRTASLSWNLTNKQEVGSPMCSLYPNATLKPNDAILVFINISNLIIT